MSVQKEGEIKDRLQNIDPYEFEHLIGDLWEEEGWKTTVSQASNDQGVDVVAEKRGTIDQKLAIQAKRYSAGNKVGRPQVQQYYSLKEQDTDADAAVVVTTSAFTKDAQLWAHDHNVKLIDGDSLVSMIERHGAYDLLDEYAPPLEELEDDTTETVEFEPDPEPETGTGTSSADGTGKAKWVFTALVSSVVGVGLVLDPSLVPVLPSGVATALFTLGWFTAPVFIFLDALGLHRLDAETQPNRLIWPTGAFMVPVLVPLWYLMNRA